MEKGYSSVVWLYGGRLVHKGSPWCLWGVSLWKYDQKVWDSFSHFIKFEVADDGYDIKFWTDVWCGDSTLKFSFPELYRIAWNQDAFVGSFTIHKWVDSLGVEFQSSNSRLGIGMSLCFWIYCIPQRWRGLD